MHGKNKIPGDRRPGPSTVGDRVIRATQKLSREVSRCTFSTPVAVVYNPLDYAWNLHRQYLERFANRPRRCLMMGMNPGPWGMAQTGVPFGEIDAVRDFLEISGEVKQPKHVHPKRPIEGLGCARKEVSGQRLWALMKTRFGSSEAFFKEHYITNYCPLAFLAESGANLTPDKLKAAETGPLFEACDRYLKTLIRLLEPEMLIGVGKFAEKILERQAPAGVRVLSILHPSPASPAANRGWAEQVVRALEAEGVW